MADDGYAEVNRALGRVEGKADAILSNISTLQKDHEKLREDHSSLAKRVTAIDGKLQWYAGAGAVALFLVGFFKDKLLGMFP